MSGAASIGRSTRLAAAIQTTGLATYAIHFLLAATRLLATIAPDATPDFRHPAPTPS